MNNYIGSIGSIYSNSSDLAEIENIKKGSKTQKEQLMAASKEFESIFIAKMLTEMDKTIDKEGSLFQDSKYLDNFKSFMYNDIASPTGIASDKNGNVYVACFSDNMIYKITPDGKKIIFIKDAKISGPIDMVNDDAGNIYVSNYNSNNVIKITPAGVITVLISNIQKPYGVHINGDFLYVSSQGSNSVLKYKL